MNFPSETTNDKVALKARQRAYLASLNAQITQQNRQQALDKIDEGHYVRNLPATPDFQSHNRYKEDFKELEVTFAEDDIGI